MKRTLTSTLPQPYLNLDLPLPTFNPPTPISFEFLLLTLTLGVRTMGRPQTPKDLQVVRSDVVLLVATFALVIVVLPLQSRRLSCAPRGLSEDPSS